MLLIGLEPNGNRPGFCASVGEPLFLAWRRPAHTGRNRGLIVFALDHELRAALIEAEHFVVEIEPVHDKAKPVREPNAALGVHLEMRIKVDVAERAGNTA